MDGHHVLERMEAILRRRRGQPPPWLEVVRADAEAGSVGDLAAFRRGMAAIQEVAVLLNEEAVIRWMRRRMSERSESPHK